MSTIERDALAARWLELTREVMPGMAAAQRWPVHLDHCFMRICLDAALGAPWTRTCRPPAIRTMTDMQLRTAIEVAESLVAEPARLFILNARSLAGRRAARIAA
jgi:hypothetical protein